MITILPNIFLVWETHKHTHRVDLNRLLLFFSDWTSVIVETYVCTLANCAVSCTVQEDCFCICASNSRAKELVVLTSLHQAQDSKHARQTQPPLSNHSHSSFQTQHRWICQHADEAKLKSAAGVWYQSQLCHQHISFELVVNRALNLLLLWQYCLCWSPWGVINVLCTEPHNQISWLCVHIYGTVYLQASMWVLFYVCIGFTSLPCYCFHLWFIAYYVL